MLCAQPNLAQDMVSQTEQMSTNAWANDQTNPWDCGILSCLADHILGLVRLGTWHTNPWVDRLLVGVTDHIH